MDDFIVISGCSGGGKSTLLAELAQRGYGAVEEPGRRIIAEERTGAGCALPWIDLSAFAERAMDLSRQDRQRTKHIPGPIFFDRGLVDAAAALEYATGKPVLRMIAGERYNRTVFMAPPWPEIYVADDDRQHPLEEAIQEYERLISAYSLLDYDIVILPKTAVSGRADFIVQRLGLA